MELSYAVAEDGSLNNIRFDGLDGRERVTSLKEALGVLKITNPAVKFTQNAKAGLYDDISDTEYNQILSTTERISLLWRYGDNPDGQSTEFAMNALMLLANAIEMIGQMHAQLRQVSPGTESSNKGCNGDPPF